MKKYILFGMLLMMFNILTRAEYYYYYQGEKIPLVVSTDSVTIYATLANMQISNHSDSIIISTVPIEKVNQISVQENIDILSIEYLIGDSIATQKNAQEMQENGVSVSELQTQLLQKIEELTLYLIQQGETIQELRQEVEQLKK